MGRGCAAAESGRELGEKARQGKERLLLKATLNLTQNGCLTCKCFPPLLLPGGGAASVAKTARHEEGIAGRKVTGMLFQQCLRIFSLGVDSRQGSHATRVKRDAKRKRVQIRLHRESSLGGRGLLSVLFVMVLVRWFEKNGENGSQATAEHPPSHTPPHRDAISEPAT